MSLIPARNAGDGEFGDEADAIEIMQRITTASLPLFDIELWSAWDNWSTVDYMGVAAEVAFEENILQKKYFVLMSQAVGDVRRLLPKVGVEVDA